VHFRWSGGARFSAEAFNQRFECPHFLAGLFGRQSVFAPEPLSIAARFELIPRTRRATDNAQTRKKSGNRTKRVVDQIRCSSEPP
jgi:hypothetical protein